jgi:hypothetical protein
MANVTFVFYAARADPSLHTCSFLCVELEGPQSILVHEEEVGAIKG